MMSTGPCPTCREPITTAFIEDGERHRPVALDPKADPLGRVYVDHWDNGHRIVVVMEDSEDIPGHVPLRYRLHRCRGGR